MTKSEIEGAAAAAEVALNQVAADWSLTAAERAGCLAAAAAQMQSGATQIQEWCLAYFASLGHPRAVRAVEEGYFPQLQRNIERGSRGLIRWDDLASELYARLFVPDEKGNAGAIAKFSGQGSLAGWLKVYALRLGGRITTAQRREQELDPVAVLTESTGQAPVEIELLRQKYRTEFREAVTAAFAALEPVAKNLLRFHYLDGATTEQLARSHQVHRATVVRWLTAAREQMLAATRERLKVNTGLASQDIDSLVKVMADNLGASLLKAFERDER